jgi:chemotaxis protein histidine kinase CheA/CheY-like chemotaxis protein
MTVPTNDIVPLFLAELFEQLGRLSETLLQLEGKDASQAPEAVTSFMRDAHSVKGTSASFGFPDIARVAHSMEEVMLGIRETQRQVTRADADALLEALDALRERGEGIQRNGRASEEGLLRLAQVADLLTVPTAPPDRSEAEWKGQGAPASKKLAAAAASPSPLPQDLQLGVMRISYRQIQAIEKPAERLRLLRGRLLSHGLPLSKVTRELDRLFQQSRDRRFKELQRLISGVARGLAEDEAQLATHVRDLDDSLRTAQLVPLEILVEGLRHTVLQQARRAGKSIRFDLRGGDLKIDRRIFDAVKDPLVHLLRNAIDHGLESPAERLAKEKPEVGTVTIEAVQQAEALRIEVSDDGGGIDHNLVRAKAVERGLVSQAEADRLTDEDARALIFRPGFSTAKAVTETSGRGVGLDVVALAVNRLAGSIECHTTLGHGTRFGLVLPRSQTSERVFLVEVAERRVAIKMSAVERIQQVRASAVSLIGGLPVVNVGDEQLLLVNLADMLKLPEWHSSAARFPVVVLANKSRRVGLRCSRIVRGQDAVVKALPRELAGLRHLSGLADMGDGQFAFVFNEETLFQDEAPSAEEPVSRRAESVTVLVVDDTVATRALHRRMLEAAGYRVLAAANGEEALRVLESQRVQLVVTDIEMPQLDGIGLLQRMRSIPRLARIPSILVSSLAPSSRKGKLVNSQELADAYVTKSDFQAGALVETVKRLVARIERNDSRSSGG